MPNNTSPIRKRSLVIAGHKTSVSVEDEFWETIKTIAVERRLSLGELVTETDKQRQARGNLSSAIRLHALAHYRELAERLSASARQAG